MHWMPYLEHKIYTSKSPEEICTALKVVTKSREETAFRPYIEFIGEIRPLDFDIRNNICFRNDFAPMITGSIKEEGSASVVALKMRVHHTTYVSCVFGNCMLGFLCLIVFLGSIMTGDFKVLPFTALIGVFAFQQIVMRLWFYIPAKKSIQKLETLLR